MKSGKKYWADGTPVAGQQFEYGFDDIGNRTSTKAGGDENGANLRPASYTPNSLNQYSSRSVTGAVQVTGISFATNSVLVNGQTAYRKGEYFWKELLTNNSSAPIWMTVTATATNQAPISGNVFLPKTAEIFGYDPDGNMTNDGRFVYTWDAENRLLAAESLASSPLNSKRKVTWEFDGKGRRIRQTTYDGSSGTYALAEDLKFVSDGWRHIAELNAANNSLVRSYLWGLDLSGSFEGAGGVGGLLVINSTANGAHFTCHDGNGNIVALVNAATSARSAAYEYGPFGEPVRLTGPLAKEHPFRFSTKRANEATDLALYEYRPYSAGTGRWLSRDPVQEKGGPNLHAFTRNAIDSVDALGLWTELWYGMHRVKPVMANHSKLWLLTDESALVARSPVAFRRALSKTLSMPEQICGPPPMWLLTIGAGPPHLLSEELVAEFDRKGDWQNPLTNPTLVTSFQTPGEALAFIEAVQQRNRIMNQNFRDTTLEYEKFPNHSRTEKTLTWDLSKYRDPDHWDEFNSNSYISGLLMSLNYTPPDFPSFIYLPGYDKAIPPFVFMMSFSSTASLKAEWECFFGPFQ